MAQRLSRRAVSAIAVAFGLCGMAVPADGDPISVFTFEQFTVPPGDFGTRTPLLDVAPNIGSTSFRADFTTSPLPDLFAVASFPHSFTSGNLLIGRHGHAHSLTLTFNEFITSVSFPFLTTGFAGTLQLSSPVGTTAMTAGLTGDAGDFFTAGVLSFASSAPFRTFTLSTASNPSEPGCCGSFAIDNLRVEISPVPEPTTLFLVGSGILGVLRMRHARRRR
jgi:hypothetical protein